ncbi:MAG: hypothetical protein Q8P20_08735 [bacterium]|nr:hypothetical protein [bacterium]
MKKHSRYAKNKEIPFYDILFVLGLFLLVLAMINLISYFHVADLLLNSMHHTKAVYFETGKWIEFEELNIVGNYVGGYSEQHSLANIFYFRAERSLTFAILCFMICLLLKFEKRKIK